LELVEGPNLEKDDKENVTINMVEVVRNAKIEVAKNTCPPLSLIKRDNIS
jgi:hypothetical protein